jgi:uncharacterized protein YbjQ (UPF0145 family)
MVLGHGESQEGGENSFGAPAAKRMAEDAEKLGADGVGNIIVCLVVRNGKRGGSNGLRDGGGN